MADRPFLPVRRPTPPSAHTWARWPTCPRPAWACAVARCAEKRRARPPPPQIDEVNSCQPVIQAGLGTETPRGRLPSKARVCRTPSGGDEFNNVCGKADSRRVMLGRPRRSRAAWDAPT